jgi:hypothetical protein
MPARSAFVIAILLGFTRAAAADSVDWNQYVEKPGTTYTEVAKQAAVAKPAPEKAAKKTVATKPKTKVKAPVRARRKAR